MIERRDGKVFWWADDGAVLLWNVPEKDFDEMQRVLGKRIEDGVITGPDGDNEQ